MPRAAASRITSTGKCFSSSQRNACGAIFSAANSRAISRTATWSSLRANCIFGTYLGRLLAVIASEAKQSSLPCSKLDCFVALLLAMTAFGSTASVHRRDRELRAFLDAGRPARGDGLGLGVEADRIRTVLVEIAEAGLLPAAEGVVGDRHRDRHVNADHADLDLGREVARGVAVAGEDRNAIAVVMVRRQCQRFLVVVRAHHRQHGAEYFFLVNTHVLGDVVEQRTAEIEALFVALHLEATAVDGERSTLLDADIDVALHLLDRF